jgi:hypothetical protein
LPTISCEPLRQIFIIHTATQCIAAISLIRRAIIVRRPVSE